MSADDWIAAALAALADGGVGAVAVEPLAARLGATKGSFYWHFRNRDALLEATLAHWERIDTEQVIAEADARPDLRRRLRWLFRAAIGGADGLPTASSVELALQPSAAHPLVAPVLTRVTRRRLDYLGTVFADLGLPPAAARHRAVLAYTAYLGHVRLARAAPGVAPADLDAYADEVVAVLTAPSAAP